MTGATGIETVKVTIVASTQARVSAITSRGASGRRSPDLRRSARLTALQAIHDNAKWVGDPVQVCGWLMLEYGLRGSETAEQWARWAAGELTERLDTPS